MTTVLYIVIIALTAFIAIGAFCIAHGEKKQRIQEQNEKNEVIENAQNAANIITHANEQKKSIQSGNSINDFNNSISLLHNIAKH